MKLTPEKKALTGFEPMTSAIKPTGSWSRCEFVIYPQMSTMYDCSVARHEVENSVGFVSFNVKHSQTYSHEFQHIIRASAKQISLST